MNGVNATSGNNKTYKKVQIIECNSCLKIEPNFGEPSYYLRITTQKLIEKSFLDEILCDNFFYKYSTNSNFKGEFNLFILITQNNIDKLKPLIPILMMNAKTNTIWASLVTEYDSHGITLPEFILSLLKENCIMGFDFSFTVV